MVESRYFFQRSGFTAFAFLAMSAVLFVPQGRAAITISPATTPSVPQGQTQSFTSNQPVNWSLSSGSAGTLTPVGGNPSTQATYQAPANVPVSQQVGACIVGAPDNIYNTRIDGLPVDPKSATWMGVLSAVQAGTPGFRVNYLYAWGENVLTPTTPYSVIDEHFCYSSSNNAPYKLPSWPYLDRQSGVFSDPSDGEDRHTLTFDQAGCRMYEVYNDFPAGTAVASGSCAGRGYDPATVTAVGGFQYDSISYDLPGANDSPSNAACIPMSPLTVRLADFRSGEIKHAGYVTLTNNLIGMHQYVWPAHCGSAGNATTDDPSLPSATIPYGARFRLKSSFNINAYSGYTKMLLLQVQRYGMIMSDGGTDMQVSLADDVAWDQDVVAGIYLFNSLVKMTDLEIVDESSLMVSPDSTRVNAANVPGIPPLFAVVNAADPSNASSTVSIPIALQGVTVWTPDQNLWVQSGVSRQLSSVVKGAANTSVTWSMNPTLGTLSGTGLYTAPAVSSPAVTMITATSAADPTAFTSVKVTVMPTGPIRVVVAGASVGPNVPNTHPPDYGPDSQGNMWWGHDGGQILNVLTGDLHGDDWYPESAWPSTPDVSLFYTIQYAAGDMLWHFTVPNGNYKVNLLFDDGDYCDAGSQLAPSVGPVKLVSQGQIVSNSWDWGASINHACRTLSTTVLPAQVTDNELRFGLYRMTFPGDANHDPSINAIDIEPDQSNPTITLNPSTFTVLAGGTVQFSAVYASIPSGVTWTVASGPGTISAGGFYQAPSSISGTSAAVTIAATSTSNSSIVATASLTVVPVPVQTPPPTISPNGGTFQGSAVVTLADPGATIHYQTDGTVASTYSPVYSAPFTLSVNSTVSAMASVSGQTDSTVATASFVITPVSQPTLSLTPTALSFTGLVGASAPGSQPLNIQNSGSGTLAWSIGAIGASWLTASPSSGSLSAGQSVNVTVATSLDGLNAGTFNGTLGFSASGAVGSPQSIPVTLKVNPVPNALFAAAVSEVDFSTGIGAGVLPAQTLTLSNSGNTELSWSAVTTAPWLTVAASHQTLAPNESIALTITVDVSGLAPNQYQQSVTFLSSAATNSPFFIPVNIKVLGPTSSAASVAGLFQPRVYPNPWRKDKSSVKRITFDSLGAGSTVKIYSLSGHLVNTLKADTNGFVQWDLTTSSGQDAASGIYIYLVKNTQGSRVSGKFALLH